MTKSVGAPPGERCRWCRRTLPARSGPGRPRAYCSGRCRQADWVAGRRAIELDLSESELIVARRDLERLYDDLDILGRALADTERDLDHLGDEDDVDELRRILGWLLDAARTVDARRLDPA